MVQRVPNVRLRAAREHRQWTQQEVAEMIGSTSLTMGRWERGETSPSLYFRRRLCDLLEMTPEDLGFIETADEAPSQQEEHDAGEGAGIHEQIAAQVPAISDPSVPLATRNLQVLLRRWMIADASLALIAMVIVL